MGTTSCRRWGDAIVAQHEFPAAHTDACAMLLYVERQKIVASRLQHSHLLHVFAGRFVAERVQFIGKTERRERAAATLRTVF